MKRSQFFKLYLLIFIVLYSEFNSANQESYLQYPYAGNDPNQSKNECPRVGSISGRIIVPENNNYVMNFNNEIAIRIGGIDYSHEENKRFEYYPDEAGCFAVDSIFPAGSSVSLYIWDKNGFLNNKVVPAYVGLKTNYYDIRLSSYSYISHLSEVFTKGVKQSFASAGVCGYAIGLSPGDILGTTVNIENTNGKTFTPRYYDYEDIPSPSMDELTENGHFCFFNLNPCENGKSTCTLNSDYYKLSFSLKNGVTRTFNLYLPPYSFSDYNFYDLNTAVYRPIEAFSIKNYFGDFLTSSSWTPVPNFNIRTSDDYSGVNVSKKPNSNDLVFFPLGDDFITLDYKMELSQSDRFFILKPRAEVFTERFVSMLKGYEPGQIFVDKNDPILLKIFEPNSLNIKQEYLTPLYKADLGSLFLSLDLTKYKINKNSAYVFLRDLPGKQVSSFVPITNSNNESLNGFFYNLNPGLYQLFIVNGLNGDILYSSLVQSFANKTQVITDIIEKGSEDLNDKQNSRNQIYIVDAYNKNNIKNKEVDVIPWNQRTFDNAMGDIYPDDEELPSNSKSIENSHQEQIDIMKNIYNKYRNEELCSFIPIKAKNKSSKITEEKFMGIVPKVKFLPSEQIINILN